MRFKFMFNRKILGIVTIFLINILISSQYFAQLPPLSTGWETTKRGGVAFRVGGNQTMVDLNAYAALFNTHGYKFSFAMALGESQFTDPSYIVGVKALQVQGHELLDLTPNFRINYFSTEFSPSVPSEYVSNPGVDHIVGEKICLKFNIPELIISISDSISNGSATISGNIVTFNSGFSGNFKVDDYLFFPSLPNSKLFIINQINSTTQTILIKDVWGDNITSLDISTATPYYHIYFKEVHMTQEALTLLGNESLKLAGLYGITELPEAWIAPGTVGTPYGITPLEVMQTFGTLGFTSGQTYPPTTSIKTYNEYDPDGTRRFGMQWGDFDEEEWTINEIKTQIADKIALHRVLFNHNHFKKDYFINTSSLLAWCKINNIPVLTRNEWANMLYGTTQDVFINIFPPLNVDLDENNIPDG